MRQNFPVDSFLEKKEIDKRVEYYSQLHCFNFFLKSVVPFRKPLLFAYYFLIFAYCEIADLLSNNSKMGHALLIQSRINPFGLLYS